MSAVIFVILMEYSSCVFLSCCHRPAVADRRKLLCLRKQYYESLVFALSQYALMGSDVFTYGLPIPAL